MNYERLNRIPRRMVEPKEQPMPAEAWSDHEDANEQFNSADREAFPWVVAAVVAFAFLCAWGLSQVDWSAHVPA